MNYQYLLGDCREVLKTIPDKSVNLVVTSPPYNIGKPYGRYSDKIPLNEWKDLIDAVTKEVFRILTPNGSFFLNLSPVPLGSDKEIIPLPFIGYEIMQKNGFALRNMITWTFNNMQNCTNRLSGRYENILWGVKDIKNYIFNLDSVRLPYLTQNDKRLEGGIGRNPTDVWYFDRVNNMTKKKLQLTHPTVYPLSMIVRIIKMATNEGDTILDPFAGSGTSLVAAKILNRNGIGIELDEHYKNEYLRRMETEGQQPASNFDELKPKEKPKNKKNAKQTEAKTITITKKRQAHKEVTLSLFADEDKVETLFYFLSNKYKFNIVKWEPNSTYYPKYMLLSGDKGILAYIHIQKDEKIITHAEYDTRTLAKEIEAAESDLDRPVFYLHWLDINNFSSLHFETSAQLKEYLFNNPGCTKLLTPLSQMGDFENLIATFQELKNNGVKN